VANTDFAPTVADWAGLQPPGFVDGRSLDPLLSANPPATWRRQLLIEIWLSHPFRGLRTSDGRTYIEYENGERELYNLRADPYQLNSRHRSRGQRALMEELHTRLQKLKNCSGQDSCGAAEDWPRE
jgi:arylsulfatase A-like enzyme